MIFNELPEFSGDVKKLSKKYRSLPEDLEIIKKVLVVYPDERPPFSYRINNLGLKTAVIKVKKMACKSIKGKGVHSGLRLIYAFILDSNEITLIEIYHKNSMENEDRERILGNFE